MDKSFGLPSALAVQAMKPASTGTASPFPGDYRDRLAQRMNDTVVRRIFAAGLDLQAALGLIDGHHSSIEHRLTLKICHAADELDHAIRDLRDILFERGPG